MSLIETERSGLSAADIAAVTGNNGFGYGDNSFWLLILFLFAFMGNGWGNGYNGGNSGVATDVQRGFDQQSIMSTLAGINTGINTGFANAEVARCGSQANILQAINTNQAATTAAMNNLAAGLQDCCCENRASIADLKYTIATEACADRAAISDGIRDVISANTASTQAILDKLCQQEIDALKTENANLQTQINLANLQASQTAQTSRILSDNSAQTQALEQYLNPVPVPAYIVQNPNGGCGCAAV